MRQQIGGKKEPLWRCMLRCPCFWGENFSYKNLCLRWHAQRLLGREWTVGRITAWSLRWHG